MHDPMEPFSFNPPQSISMRIKRKQGNQEDTPRCGDVVPWDSKRKGNIAKYKLGYSRNNLRKKGLSKQG